MVFALFSGKLVLGCSIVVSIDSKGHRDPHKKELEQKEEEIIKTFHIFITSFPQQSINNNISLFEFLMTV